MADLPRPKIEVIPTRIAVCFELRPTVIDVQRGFFAKGFPHPHLKTRTPSATNPNSLCLIS